MPGWDLHTHLVPATVVASAHAGTHGVAVDDGRLHVDAGRLPLRRLTDVAALEGWIDEQDLDGAVVSVPPPLYRYHLDGEAAHEWAGLVNAGLAALAVPRLRTLATLPLGDPGLSAKTAEDVLATGVYSGVALGTLTTPTGLADPAYDPLWELLHRARAFVLLHPATCPDSRLGPFYLSNLLGNPYETALAAAQLIFSGVLERFPGIGFCLCHGGGALPALVGRWQRGRDTERPGVPRTGLTPREAARRLLVDDLVYDADAARLLEATFGAERVHVGSDWPFPLRAPTLDARRAAARASDAELLTRPIRYVREEGETWPKATS
ncbi:amidohydrolase family protein [Pseudonocardia acaciae]|uniref:amidohydrolase family protein n=1 Tax=Pseudonocardia acaciae TaxID=551276 RepID=UPI0006844200|nr:amidohydrolase family protein [Pseudonocardia acaciae]